MGTTHAAKRWTLAAVAALLLAPGGCEAPGGGGGLHFGGDAAGLDLTEHGDSHRQDVSPDLPGAEDTAPRRETDTAPAGDSTSTDADAPITPDADALPDTAGPDDVATPDADASDEDEGPCVPDCGERACGPDPVCGTSCGTCGEGLLCSAGGVCESSCGEGASLCDGACVDTTDDPSYCGDCETACDPGQVCEGSTCKAAADCQEVPCSGFTYCDLASGECKPGCIDDGQCQANERCDKAAHACVCVDGYHDCQGACVSDDAVEHCGESCEPCAGDPHGTATCDGTSCGVVCDSDALACGDGCAPCPDEVSGVRVCSGGACILDCDPGYGWCGGACRTDTPDLAFEDTDCDGIDGNAETAIFVSPDGDDGDDGDMDGPLATLGEAMARAAETAGDDTILVAAGVYEETVELVGGVGLYGGYHPDTWERSEAHVSEIRGGATAVLAEGLDGDAKLQLLTIVAADATGTAASSYAVRVVDSPGRLVVEGCTLVAGDGTDGSDRSEPSQAPDGVEGDPSFDAGSYWDGGAGADPADCARPGGAGGDGGFGGYTKTGETTHGEDGDDGGDTSKENGGDGGNGGINAPPWNRQGGSGWSGGSGDEGSAAPELSDPLGSATSGGFYAPASGARGEHGTGGGGGGGGGGGSYYGPSANIGGGGGGGGSGGCGGRGGPGGGGGGGSFGVFVDGGTVSSLGNDITTGHGGHGGDGARGGRGGEGGWGGDGKELYMGNQHDGGDGGKGGWGARGGPGGGGAGGPSIGLFAVSGSIVSDGDTIATGSGGSGGAGGEESGGDGPGGPSGLVDDVACAAGASCVDPATCTCEGKTCGDDGCGQSCGSCPDGDFCDGSGQCVESQAGLVLINEALYDAVGADDDTWVELKGPPGHSLDGWKLQGINGNGGGVTDSAQLSGTIGSSGYYLVVYWDASAALVDLADEKGSVDFQNGPDSIRLLDADGEVVDAVGYGEFSEDEVFAGEGSPCVDPPAGHSIARMPDGKDTGDNAADFVGDPSPTPGQPNL